MPVESRLDGLSSPGVNADDILLPGLSTGVCTEDALLPPVRFLLLRTVMVEGMKFCPRADPLLGEARGGVDVGPGSFDLAECTLCSMLCILLMRPCKRLIELD